MRVRDLHAIKEVQVFKIIETLVNTHMFNYIAEKGAKEMY